MLAAFLGEIETSRTLLEKGASVSLVNCYGRTPLMLAAMAGHEDIVQLLLTVGAAPDGVDAWGRDAAGWAEVRGYPHVARLIKTAARERRQWMISQMRGGPGVGAGGSILPFMPQAAAFDPVAERAERGALLRATNQAVACSNAASNAAVASEAKLALQNSVRGKAPPSSRSGWGLGVFSQRRAKESSPTQGNKRYCMAARSWSS